MNIKTKILKNLYESLNFIEDLDDEDDFSLSKKSVSQSVKDSNNNFIKNIALKKNIKSVFKSLYRINSISPFKYVENNDVLFSDDYTEFLYYGPITYGAKRNHIIDFLRKYNWKHPFNNKLNKLIEKDKEVLSCFTAIVLDNYNGSNSKYIWSHNNKQADLRKLFNIYTSVYPDNFENTVDNTVNLLKDNEYWKLAIEKISKLYNEKYGEDLKSNYINLFDIQVNEDEGLMCITFNIYTDNEFDMNAYTVIFLTGKVNYSLESNYNKPEILKLLYKSGIKENINLYGDVITFNNHESYIINAQVVYAELNDAIQRFLDKLVWIQTEDKLRVSYPKYENSLDKSILYNNNLPEKIYTSIYQTFRILLYKDRQNLCNTLEKIEDLYKHKTLRDQNDKTPRGYIYTIIIEKLY